MPDKTQNQPEFPSAGSPTTMEAGIPQFAKAEYPHPPGVDHCRICSNLISGDYYRIHNQMACVSCAEQARNGQPTDNHAAFARGLLFGSGGAVAGLILYATVAIVTGWTIGYLALAVGWLVGKGITKGSNGLGGRRYQIAALILTYFAISMAAIPIGISYAMKERPAAAHRPVVQNSDSANPSSPSIAEPKPRQDIRLGALVGELLLMGLASPFMAFTANLGSAAIGLFILFIGLRIAWALTAARGIQVDGPYVATAP